MRLGCKERQLLEAIFGKRDEIKFIVSEKFLGIKSLKEIFTDIILTELTGVKNI